MAPQFVKPYVNFNKNDAADAEGIFEAVKRPGMQFVALKEVEQQDSVGRASHPQSGGEAAHSPDQLNSWVTAGVWS